MLTFLEDVIYASLGRVAEGNLAADEIIPGLERAIWLLAGVPVRS